MRKKISKNAPFFIIIKLLFLNGHNFLNLDPKIFVLVPENREFISLQENLKKYLF